MPSHWLHPSLSVHPATRRGSTTAFPSAAFPPSRIDIRGAGLGTTPPTLARDFGSHLITPSHVIITPFFPLVSPSGFGRAQPPSSLMHELAKSTHGGGCVSLRCRRKSGGVQEGQARRAERRKAKACLRWHSGQRAERISVSALSDEKHGVEAGEGKTNSDETARYGGGRGLLERSRAKHSGARGTSTNDQSRVVKRAGSQ